MMLIAGLGNPGKRYQKNRHNTGFIILEELRKLWNFPDFEMNKKFNAEISEGNYKLQTTNYKLLLARPQTFMNNSGIAVKKIMDFYKLTAKDLIVIHDDLDIELGKYKLSSDSSSAGHKGVENIIDVLGTQDFKRFRVGIEGETQRKNRTIPGDQPRVDEQSLPASPSLGGRVEAGAFVLQNFSKEDLKIVQNLAKEIATTI